MRKGKIYRQFKNFEIYKDLYGKPCKRDWVAKVVFLIHSLLRYTAENYQVTQFDWLIDSYFKDRAHVLQF